MRFSIRLILVITVGVAIVIAAARINAAWMPVACGVVGAVLLTALVADRPDWRQNRLHGIGRGCTAGAGFGGMVGCSYYGFTLDPGYQGIVYMLPGIFVGLFAGWLLHIPLWRLADHMLPADPQRERQPASYSAVTRVCPVCEAVLPRIRFACNFREWMWGGLTCNECGLQLDEQGQPVDREVAAKLAQTPQRPPAPERRLKRPDEFSLADLDSAIAEYNQRIAFEPHNGEWYLQRARVYRKLYQFEEALNDLGQAISLMPNHVEPYLERANLLETLGRTEEAAVDERTAYRLQGGN